MKTTTKKLIISFYITMKVMKTRTKRNLKMQILKKNTIIIIRCLIKVKDIASPKPPIVAQVQKVPKPRVRMMHVFVHHPS